MTVALVALRLLVMDLQNTQDAEEMYGILGIGPGCVRDGPPGTVEEHACKARDLVADDAPVVYPASTDSGSKGER